MTAIDMLYGRIRKLETENKKLKADNDEMLGALIECLINEDWQADTVIDVIEKVTEKNIYEVMK